MGLFSSLFKKKSSGDNAEGEAKETKKCLRCLRRIPVDKNRCPHCGCSDFQYNS